MAQAAPRVLIADGNTESRGELVSHLRLLALNVVPLESFEATCGDLVDGPSDALVFDEGLFGDDVGRAVRRLLALRPELPILVTADPAHVERALVALWSGAEELLLRPFHLGLAATLLDRTLAPARRSAPPASWTLDQVERWHIERVLGEEMHDVERTAQRLGIARSTLYQRLHGYGIPTRRRSATVGKRQANELFVRS
jgi:DNA-binding NtrC family response regulator